MLQASSVLRTIEKLDKGEAVNPGKLLFKDESDVQDECPEI